MPLGRYIIENPEPPSAIQNLSQNIGRLGEMQLKMKMSEYERKKKFEDEIALLTAKTNAEMNSPLGQLDYNTKLSTLNKNRWDLGQPLVGQQEPSVTSPSLGRETSGMIPETYEFTASGVRPKTFMNPEAEIHKELIKGAGADSGRVALAQESIKNIQDIKKILFPGGTSKSFKRTTAFASNLPGGSLPILPSRGWGQAEQDVFRKMGAALSGRQLIQTGVAARPEETQKLISQFAPSVGSNPEAALNGLNELENFYKNYLQKADPETRFGNKPVFKQQNAPTQQGQYTVGQVIQSPNGKKYKVIGGDMSDPDVEEIQ